MRSLFFISLIAMVFLSCFKREAKADFENSDKGKKDIDTTEVISENAPTTVLNRMDYETANSVNTLDAWRRFLIDNPNFEKKTEIEEKIIREEVNEILRDKETLEMPQYDKVDDKISKTSSIIIDNNTSCDLILRYVGKDVKKVVVPPNRQQKIPLSSGNYQVTASVCGLNYAGNENLMGNYEVVYYIETTRY